MTDEAKRLVDALREDAEWAQANEWETPIMLGDNLTAAADMIEKLSADLESDERQKSREIFEISSKAIAKLEADRDAWKLLCEAAERDLGWITPCMSCAHEFHPAAALCKTCDHTAWRKCNYTWRGPCEENGGMKDD